VKNLFFLKACFADPINKKMIKETFTLFLSHQQQTLENEQSIDYNNEQQTEAEREIHAVEIVQVKTILLFVI